MRRPYGILRKPLFYRTFVWMLQNLPFALPVERLRETEHLLAFRHPKPAYAFHVLIMPKEAIASLADLDAAETAFLSDLIRSVQSLVAEFQLPAYRLIVNGGDFQEFPHLHFHLISETDRQPLETDD